MTPPRRNVEIKARDPDPATTLERALALGASDEGVLVQRDTYFGGARGRLKLREQKPGGAHLIAYVRPDSDEARTSSYRLADVGDPAAVREALDAALGTRVVVEKRRRLLLWEGVRIHLDEVEGLGSFVELEGVAAPESDLARERELVARLRDELGLGELVPVSLLRPAPRRARDTARSRRGGHAQRLRRATRTSRSAPRCGRRRARSTRAPTSRTPPIHRASAPRRRRSGRWSPAARARSRRSRSSQRSSTSALRAEAVASG